MHIYSISNPGVEIELIFALQAAVSEIWAEFQIGVSGHETCLAIGQSCRSCTIFLSQGEGLKLGLYPHYGHGFPGYGPIFKIAIFGHLAKAAEVAHTRPFYPRGIEIELIFTLRAAVSKIDKGRFSKLPHLGMKLGHWPKFQNLHI